MCIIWYLIVVAVGMVSAIGGNSHISSGGSSSGTLIASIVMVQ